MPRCEVCFRHCTLSEGQRGFCGARICENGAVISENYGKITSVALDPIEKKPLNRFHPGKMILSVGSYGCNLRCPFCQNYDISWSELAMSCQYKARYLSPEELTKLALSCKDKGNIGVAFTYNEPLIGYEYVRDTAKLIHDAGMLNPYAHPGTSRTDPSDTLRDFQEYLVDPQLPEDRCGLFRQVLPPGAWTVRLRSRRGRSCLR